MITPINDVRQFMAAAEQITAPGQTGKQVGFCAEEMVEGLQCLSPLLREPGLRIISKAFKAGLHADLVQECDQEELLDFFLDLAYVAIGGAIAMGANVEGAWSEVQRANMGKVDPVTGKLMRDANGKVTKPAGWRPPNLKPFLKVAA
jgi:predicted HAD superfamily Cof-like phosphohydrolase